MKILDMTAGQRDMWVDKNNPRATFLDVRPEMKPDVVCDTRNIPDSVGKDFDLIVYDPPHVNCGPNGHMAKRYGHFTTKEILDSVAGSGKEAWRISRPGALMILKWNDKDIRLKRVLDLLPNWEPLFGQLTKYGPGSKTHWVTLLRKD